MVTACDALTERAVQRPDAETRANMTEAELQQLCRDDGVLKLRFAGLDFDASVASVTALESARWEQTIRYVTPDGMAARPVRESFCQIEAADRADVAMVKLEPRPGEPLRNDEAELLELWLFDERLREVLINGDRSDLDQRDVSRPYTLNRIDQVAVRLASASYLGERSTNAQELHYFANYFSVPIAECRDLSVRPANRFYGMRQCTLRWDIEGRTKTDQLAAQAILVIAAGEEERLPFLVNRLAPRLIAVATSRNPRE